VIIASMTLATAVLAMSSDRSLMDLNVRNAARYATTTKTCAQNAREGARAPRISWYA